LLVDFVKVITTAVVCLAPAIDYLASLSCSVLCNAGRVLGQCS